MMLYGRIATDMYGHTLIKITEVEIMKKANEDWKVNRLREDVARDIANDSDLSYMEIMEWMEDNHVFSNWEAEEFNRRPVNVDELRECIEESMGLWG